MSIAAAAVALLLAVDPAETPPAPPAAEPTPPAQVGPLDAAPPPAVPETPVSGLPTIAAPALAPTAASAPRSDVPTGRQVRAGVGLSVTDADKGFASTFQAGVQVDPWDRIGFRGGAGMTSSVVGAGGWDAAEVSGAVLYRPMGAERRVVPYAGVGFQLALLAVFPDSAPPPLRGLPRMGTGHLGFSFTSAPGEGADRARSGFGGTNQFKAMPEATAGALVQLTPGLALDVAARYLPLFWNGTTYNGLSVVASVCAPF